MALFDAWFTTRRIPQIGIEAEYNPLIRWLTRKFGVKAGIYAGVLLPTLVLMLLGFTFTKIFVFLVGARTTLFGFQMRVLKGNECLLDVPMPINGHY
jgi:hypothetical protein